MAALAIYQPDARAEARLSSALASAHDVRLTSSWDTLDSAIRRGEIEACVIDADHPDRSTATERIALMTEDHPDVAVIASAHSDSAASLFGLGGLGVDGVVVAATPAGTVRSEVDDALARARARRVARALGSRLPEPGPRAVAWAVEHASAEPSVDRLAAAMGCTTGALRDICRDANLPSPSKILLWGRLILAGARLCGDGRRVEEVAFSLGYATSTSLARAMKLHTGLSPVEVARNGGMDVVIGALASRNGREPHEPRGG